MSLFSFLKFRRKKTLERKGPKQRQKKADKKPRHKQVIVSFMVVLIWTSFTFSMLYEPTWKDDLIEKQRIPNSRYAVVNFDYEIGPTLADIHLANKSVPDIYIYDQELQEKVDAEFKNLMEQARKWKPGTTELPAKNLKEEHLITLQNLFGKDVKLSNFLERLKLGYQAGIVEEYLDKNISFMITVNYKNKRQKIVEFGNLSPPKKFVAKLIREHCAEYSVNYDDSVTALVDYLSQHVLRPNLSHSEELTSNARKKKEAALPNYKIEVLKGDPLVEKGMIASAEDIIRLKAHAEALERNEDPQAIIQQLFSNGSLALLIIISYVMYLTQSKIKELRNNNVIALLGILTSLSILYGWGTMKIYLNVLNGPQMYLYSVLPFA